MENVTLLTTDVVVVGSGAAGYNAACRLKQEGKKQVLLVTEGVSMGTSRNTGSDKQTYYKLGLGGDASDSVRKMAADLFAGGSVDGDNALCEAALSARCFLNLAELGVPFPVNRYGEYVGYKTDHDPYARATSAGPLTSHFMTEALEKRAAELQVPVYDGFLAVEILKNENGVAGVLCLEKASGQFLAIRCTDVILATGGPAGIYADSVYPTVHTGSSGLAVKAGAVMQNLTEWQYGLASVSPRWNVSGTYMQVLPRFVSIDENGVEREFLDEYFADPYEALSAVFLKGYQWPFDSRKVQTGSSVIDLLVYRECVLKKRRVYLDYQKNPFGLDKIDFHKLSDEAYTYLSKAEACFGTPIGRLEKMNRPAIDLYLGKGRDLCREYLEIALCAQHHNGGIAVDAWWQSSVPGLFAVGECAGTHGVTRPGGSALNAGQVGSLRAAQYCSEVKRDMISQTVFEELAEKHLAVQQEFCAAVMDSAEAASLEEAIRSAATCPKEAASVTRRIQEAQRRMSDCGAAIRDKEAMKQALTEVLRELCELTETVSVSKPEELYLVYQLKDLLFMQAAVLTAMIDFAEKTGMTRGSALYTDVKGELREGLEELFRFCAESGDSRENVQQVVLEENGFRVWWRPVRPIPESDDVFETVWRQYRENKNIY